MELIPNDSHNNPSRKEISVLKIHHLGHSQSERIVWLCEELGVPYELEKYTRDPVTRLSPPELKALHPLGAAPLIEPPCACSILSISRLIPRYSCISSALVGGPLISGRLNARLNAASDS